MSRVKLNKLFRNHDELSDIVREILNALQTSVSITDQNGTACFSTDAAAQEFKYPITSGSDTVGWIYTSKDVPAIATLITYLYRQELRKKALGDEVLDAYREITLLYNLSEKLTASLKVQPVARDALAEASRLIKGEFGVALLKTGNNGAANSVATFGNAELRVSDPVIIDALMDIVLESGKAEIVNQIEADQRFINCPFDVRSLIWSPFKSKQGILGVIVIGHTIPSHEYTAADLGLLKTIASLAAPAIENAMLYEDLERLVQIRTRELREARDVAEAASQAKSRFLASMSHELRTPLNALLGYAHILRREKEISGKHRDGLEIIQRSGEHLLTLINDILDLSKIEAGKLEVEAGELSLKALLRNLYDLFEARARERGISLFYECPADIPAVVTGDEKKLRQVLMNLLSNAIKFTDSGEVVLRVADAGKNIVFEVVDTGSGIQPEHIGEIFQSFTQFGPNDRLTEGTGLGLAISYQLTKIMGGELEVESEPGKGSRFWFALHLPVVKQSSKFITTENRTITGINGASYRILIIEDREESRSYLVNLLRPLGFDVAAAVSGVDGLKQLKNFVPDLILVDLVMPKIDGMETIRRIRAIRKFREVVIIALSASVFEENREASFAAGANAFLPKPIQAESLLQIIQRHLNIDWIYDSHVKGHDTPDITLPETIKPSPVELAALAKFARQGHVRGVNGEIDKLKRLDDRYHAFCDELRESARVFDMKRISQLVRAAFEN